MVNELSTWLRLLRASLMGQLSYRPSLLLEMIGRTCIVLMDMAVVFVLFTHVQDLGGWTRWEVIYLYGVASASLSLSRFLVDGLLDMDVLVRQGTLDGLLTRPVSALTQIMGRKCSPHHLSRVLTSMVAIAFALYTLAWIPSPTAISMLLINIISTTIIFSALFIAEAGTLIYTVDSKEAFNAFTYGGAHMAQYPISIYPTWLQGIFIFVVPLGYTVYYPALVVLSKPDALLLGPMAPYFAPLVSLVFLGLTLLWWQFAINHYRSTGS